MVKKILLCLLAFVLIAVAIFIAPAFLKPSLSHTNTVTINKPPKEVWEKMMAAENMGKWIKDFKSFETLSGEPGTVGSKHKLVIEQDGNSFELIETVKEIVKDEKFAFVLEGDVVTNNVVITLKDKGLTTEYTQTENFRGKGIFMRAIFYWMQSYADQVTKENLANLKKFVEEG